MHCELLLERHDQHLFPHQCQVGHQIKVIMIVVASTSVSSELTDLQEHWWGLPTGAQMATPNKHGTKGSHPNTLDGCPHGYIDGVSSSLPSYLLCPLAPPKSAMEEQEGVVGIPAEGLMALPTPPHLILNLVG